MNIHALTLVSFIVIWPGSGYAATGIEKLELKMALEAQTPEELQRAQERIFKYRTLVRACEIQVQDQLVPTQCFDKIKMASELNLDSAEPSERQHYTALCQRLARKTTQTVITDTQNVPAECLSVARERLQMNNYKSGHAY